MSLVWRADLRNYGLGLKTFLVLCVRRTCRCEVQQVVQDRKHRFWVKYLKIKCRSHLFSIGLSVIYMAADERDLQMNGCILEVEGDGGR